MNKGKKLGFAKRDLKGGETFTVELGADGLLHSDAINCFEGTTLGDFLGDDYAEITQEGDEVRIKGECTIKGPFCACCGMKKPLDEQPEGLCEDCI